MNLTFRVGGGTIVRIAWFLKEPMMFQKENLNVLKIAFNCKNISQILFCDRIDTIK